MAGARAAIERAQFASYRKQISERLKTKID